MLSFRIVRRSAGQDAGVVEPPHHRGDVVEHRLRPRLDDRHPAPRRAPTRSSPASRVLRRHARPPRLPGANARPASIGGPCHGGHGAIHGLPPLRCRPPSAPPSAPAAGSSSRRRRPRAARPAVAPPPPAPPPGAAWRVLALAGLGLAACSWPPASTCAGRPSPRRRSPTARRTRSARCPRADGRPTSRPSRRPSTRPGPRGRRRPEALRAARARRPTRRPRRGSPSASRARSRSRPDDVRAAEDLYARYPAPARDLLEAVLIGAAASHARGRAATDAAAAPPGARARRGPGEPERPRGPSSPCGAEAGDWPAAEAAARDLLALRPGDAEAARGLAYALVRQDRSREAADFLAAFLESSRDPEARGAAGADPARPGPGGRPRRGAARPLPRALRRRGPRGRGPRDPAAGSSATTRRSSAPSTTSRRPRSP